MPTWNTVFTLFIACRSLLAPYLAIEILVSVLAKARSELSRHIPEEKRVQYAILSVTLHITLCIYFTNSFANIEIYYGRFRAILEYLTHGYFGTVWNRFLPRDMKFQLEILSLLIFNVLIKKISKT